MLMAVLNLPEFTSPDARPEQRMHWLRVPFNVVLELYNGSVLKVQRNHLRRALRAKHLFGLDLPTHYNFQAGRTPDGKLHLIDGYTRLTLLKEGSTPYPSHVWLGVVDVDTKAELEALYDTVDSKYAVKRGRDAFEEGLRRSSLLDKLESTLFSGAQVVTAVITAAGHNDVRQAVWEMRAGIRVLDRLHLAAGPGKLPQGAIAALLLIASRGADVELLARFIAVLEQPTEVKPSERKHLAAATDVAKSLQNRRELGSLSGKNVGPIMEMVLGAWVSVVSGAASSTPISRADFIVLEEV
jgi:hypothetical protein